MFNELNIRKLYLHLHILMTITLLGNIERYVTVRMRTTTAKKKKSKEEICIIQLRKT